jgi:hypothetical protein
MQPQCPNRAYRANVCFVSERIVTKARMASREENSKENYEALLAEHSQLSQSFLDSYAVLKSNFAELNREYAELQKQYAAFQIRLGQLGRQMERQVELANLATAGSPDGHGAKPAGTDGSEPGPTLNDNP